MEDPQASQETGKRQKIQNSLGKENWRSEGRRETLNFERNKSEAVMAQVPEKLLDLVKRGYIHVLVYLPCGWY